jgi:hypothetical protein
MPETPEVDPQALEQWFDANLVLLLIVAGLLVALYASSSRIVHALVTRALAAQVGQVEEGSVEAAELQKRAADDEEHDQVRVEPLLQRLRVDLGRLGHAGSLAQPADLLGAEVQSCEADEGESHAAASVGP